MATSGLTKCPVTLWPMPRSHALFMADPVSLSLPGFWHMTCPRSVSLSPVMLQCDSVLHAGAALESPRLLALHLLPSPEHLTCSRPPRPAPPAPSQLLHPGTFSRPLCSRLRPSSGSQCILKAPLSFPLCPGPSQTPCLHSLHNPPLLHYYLLNIFL